MHLCVHAKCILAILILPSLQCLWSSIILSNLILTLIFFVCVRVYVFQAKLLCSCLVVARTSPTAFSDVLDSNSGAHREDMDYLNFRHAKSMNRLDPKYNALVGEWYRKDGIYHRLNLDVHNTTIVHFIAEWKPWKGSFLEWMNDVDDFGVFIYSRWWKLARKLQLVDTCTGWSKVHDEFIKYIDDRDARTATTQAASRR